MATVRPFRCIRPRAEYAKEIAALPYDVYDEKEARRAVEGRPLSFLRIDRAEVNFPEGTDKYGAAVYQKAHDLLWQMVEDGYFLQEDEPRYFIYELTMGGRTQTGLIGLASIDDYEDGTIKRHENTLARKERDRICHVDACDAQTGPIFLAYRHDWMIDAVIRKAKQKEAVYDFTAEDNVRHRVFIIQEEADIETIRRAFAHIPDIYIADGHHRAASAVQVGQMRRKAHPDFTGEEEFNFFLSVLFPDIELSIYDYNRVVLTLNGRTPEELFELLGKVCEVEPLPTARHPKEKGQFCMLLEDAWYLCTFHEDVRTDDPVDGLDVALLQNLVIEPIFGIADPKKDERIDFVGGIRGLAELERRCREDARVAFAMHPTSIEELFAVSDAGRLMPPKSTWFEPKPRSGLFIHALE